MSDDELKLPSTKVGVCIKNSQLRVLYQNEVCKDVCGSQEAKICSEGCIKHFKPILDQEDYFEGMEVLKNKKLFNEEKDFDITMLKNDDKFITLFSEVKNRKLEIEKTAEKYSLTPKQMAVFSYIFMGFSNMDILKKMNISKATLKTHVNQIYKKIPQSVLLRLRNRLSKSGENT